MKVICHQSAIFLNQTMRGKRYVVFQNVSNVKCISESQVLRLLGKKTSQRCLIQACCTEENQVDAGQTL